MKGLQDCDKDDDNNSLHFGPILYCVAPTAEQTITDTAQKK
jgi:hypothetical protein